MSTTDSIIQLNVDNIINSLVSAATVNRNAHLSLTNGPCVDGKKFGAVDYENIDEIENMISFGICSTFGLSEEELGTALKEEGVGKHAFVKVLFEDNIQNQRLTYNPSKLTWNSNYELDAVALSGGNLSSLLYLLSLSPTLVKQTSRLVVENIAKGGSSKDNYLNILVLLEEIATQVVSEAVRRITFLLDCIFTRNCEFTDEIISKQIVRVYLLCDCLIIELLGDYSAKVLELFVTSLYNINAMSDTGETPSNKSIKDMMLEYIPSMNLDLLENYIKQSFHGLNKKK